MLNNYDRDFYYCTKFSVGKGRAFKSFIKAKFSRNMTDFLQANAHIKKRDEKFLPIVVAVYEHQNWLQILDSPKLTCKEKEELAF